MKIKKGKLNYDQSGSAYPDNPQKEDNWGYIWENNGKYYKLVGSREEIMYEWTEINIYNHIIDETYKNYVKKAVLGDILNSHYEPATDKWHLYNKEEFIDRIKTHSKFSEKWGLKIEERALDYLDLKERAYAYNNLLQKTYNRKWLYKIEDIDKLSEGELMTILQNLPGPTKVITTKYQNETIITYE